MVVAGLLVCAPGCGYEQDLLDAMPRKTKTSVVVASDAELARVEAVPGSYIVTFRAPTGTASRGYASFLTEAATQYAWLDEVYRPDPRVKDIRYITTVDLANPRALRSDADFDAPPALRLAWGQVGSDELPGAITEVTFESAEAAPLVLREWEEAGAIWFAEPNYTSKLDGTGDAWVGDFGTDRQPLTQGSIGDTLEIEQYKQASSIWWHGKIQLTQAMEFASSMSIKTIESPIIAVLDSGVDVLHPALKDRIWVNSSPGSSGCLGDVNGCDTTIGQKAVLGSGTVNPFSTSGHGVSCNAAVKDVCEHGTHVAGIVAGRVDGSIGGVCPVCRVMAIRIIKNVGGKGLAVDSAILNGLKYLTLFRKGGNQAGLVRIVNASFGKATRSRAVAVVVSVLKSAPNEVLIVGAAGNEDTMLRSYPAALNDAIAVAALGEDNGKAQYSNFGPWVDVAAPGGDSSPQIDSSVPGGGNSPKQGTSMAAPVVAGIAGLILALDPTRGFEALRTTIVRTADPTIYLPEVRSGLNYNYYFVKPQGEAQRLPLLGAGQVDAKAALEGTQLNRGYLLSASPRVDNQCSTIAGKPLSGRLALVWLLLPALLAVGGGRRAHHLLRKPQAS
jgi:subtilisin family serine protease